MTLISHTGHYYVMRMRLTQETVQTRACWNTQYILRLTKHLLTLGYVTKPSPPASECLCCVIRLELKSAVSSFCFHSFVLPPAPVGQRQHLGERNRSHLSGSPLPPLGSLWNCFKKENDASRRASSARNPVVLWYLSTPVAVLPPPIRPHATGPFTAHWEITWWMR